MVRVCWGAIWHETFSRQGRTLLCLREGNGPRPSKQTGCALNGLCIKNYVLPVKSTVRVPVVSELASADEHDVIFVAARYTQVAAILDALRANKSKNVVFLGNNVQPEKLVTALPEKNVMFAFASSAGHREQDRVISVDLKKLRSASCAVRNLTSS